MPAESLPNRVVKINFPDAPTLTYESRPDVIVRLAEALRKWQPGVRIEVQSLTQGETFPELPCWRLYAWDD